MRAILMCCSLLVLASATSAARPEREVLPMEFYGTRPAVKVMVAREGPFLFLIDTGAAGAPARADISLVRHLALTRVGKAGSSDAGGATASLDEVRLPSIQLGSWMVRNVEALSRDYNGSAYLPHLDGILGINFFKDKLLTLDYIHRRIIIAGGKLPFPDGKTILPYELLDGNPAVTISLGGQVRKALVDTGDIRSIDIPTSWLRAMPLASFPRVAGTSSSVSGTTAIKEVVLADPLIIGQHRIGKPQVTFSDEFEGANLGSTFLRDFVVTVDQKKRRLALERP